MPLKFQYRAQPIPQHYRQVPKSLFYVPARAFISQPTTSEPVKLSSLNRSSVTKTSACSRGQGKTEKAPFLSQSIYAKTSAIFKAEDQASNLQASTQMDSLRQWPVQFYAQ